MDHRPGVNEVEAVQEGLTCVVTINSDSSSELTYDSPTEEEESVPTDENGRAFPGVQLGGSMPTGHISAGVLIAFRCAEGHILLPLFTLEGD